MFQKGEFMLNQSEIFSSFSVNDINQAKEFYGNKLGLQVKEFNEPGCGTMLKLKVSNGGEILIYPKEDHTPATFTVLNFKVTDIDKEVQDLKDKGIQFEHYESTGEDDIERSDSHLNAWFKDPAGNYIGVVKELQAEKSFSSNKSESEQTLQ
jgi:predicted enzyme related to lactoylglutathione lyase